MSAMAQEIHAPEVATFRVHAKKGKHVGEPLSFATTDIVEANRIGRETTAKLRSSTLTVRSDGKVMAVHSPTDSDRAAFGVGGGPRGVR